MGWFWPNRAGKGTMRGIISCAFLACAIGCGGQAPDAAKDERLFTVIVENPGAERVHFSCGKPKVEGGAAHFIEWETGKEMSVAGRFKIEEGGTGNGPKFKKK